MGAALDREPHQLVIGGMEAHQVDAPAVAVVGIEFRRMAVGERAKLDDFCGAELLTIGRQRVAGECGAFAVAASTSAASPVKRS